MAVPQQRAPTLAGGACCQLDSRTRVCLPALFRDHSKRCLQGPLNSIIPWLQEVPRRPLSSPSPPRWFVLTSRAALKVADAGGELWWEPGWHGTQLALCVCPLSSRVATGKSLCLFRRGQGISSGPLVPSFLVSIVEFKYKETSLLSE